MLVDASSANPMLTKMLGQSDGGLSYRDRLVSDAQLGLSFLSLQNGKRSDAGSPVHATELQDLAQDFDLTIVDGGLLKGTPSLDSLISVSEAVLLVSHASEASSRVETAAASDLLDMARGRYCATVLTMANA